MAFSLLPTVETDSLTDVTPALLAELGVEALFLDFDNTIVPYTTDVPTAEMQDWLHRMQSSGVFLCVVSNSKKPRVVAFCRQQGIDTVFRLNPGGHFKNSTARTAAGIRYLLEPSPAADAYP